jgi:glutamate dehydrogenase
MSAIPAVRQKIIARIAERARRSKPRQLALPAAEFIAQYYRGVAEEDLAEYDTGELAGAALAHLRFAATRKGNRPLVRIYNPSAAEHGWSSPHTVVEVTVDDAPFLVDSLGMVLSQAGLTIHLMVHPVLSVRRDRSGVLTDMEVERANGEKFRRESWQRIEVDRIADSGRHRELEQRIHRVLTDVRLAVQDWQAMRQQAVSVAQQLGESFGDTPSHEVKEVQALLEWMASNHFTFLGYREYQLQRGDSEDVLLPLAETGLGILRARDKTPLEGTRLSGQTRAYARSPQAITITKANSLSTIHRASYLDYIGIKRFGTDGEVCGEQRFLGLFTSNAYQRSPREIPLLRHKIERVIAHFGLDPASHDGKALIHVLETHPRDELFQASVPELSRMVRSIVNHYERQRVRVLLRRDAFGRFYSALVYVPRDRYSTQIRLRIEAVMREELKATSIDSQIQLSDSTLARVHLIVRVPAATASVTLDQELLEKRIGAAVQSWEDRLRDALIARHGEAPGVALAESLRSALPAGYQEDVSIAVALDDIAQLELVRADSDRLAMRLVAGEEKAIHLRLLRSAAPIALSRALPILENMGFEVLSERPYRLTVRGEREIWLQDFEMQRRDDLSIADEALGSRFTDAFVAVWTDRCENDGFNRLILTAALTWRQAMMLRAYCRYLVQTSATFSQAYMEQVLAANASIAASLAAIFATQFDPDVPTARRNRELERLREALAEQLAGVKSLDEDRILRRFAGAIAATLRTNYFQPDHDGPFKSYVSFKLDSRRVPDLPLPRPAYEIFVYSTRVEGVHLRMGQVARGGIRWSDRREDFRTEVLGLMKAQNVKNTLIVPVGAKGGFVPKRIAASATREEVQREGVECYRTFIRGLLDVTDNIVGGKVIVPPAVVRHDGDDPYLVVAADKGTAAFSDIANRISAEYDFWLGDAFASGGSAGYDHKKMGITARGGWECVKRHFREMGIDTQTQDFSVVGIGDMSGDVFGNGMLQSPHIRLLAAFNHQHVFLDPAPDAARTFKERERLFALPRSSWEDYDRSLIAKGGGIFPRSAKSIALTPEVQALVGLTQPSATPHELIRAILRMPVDLLWNGGIGTYVKAASESHQDANDRSNDGVRVNGSELRCKVVGEGGNLGFSQRGRIEYALSGGRINTDFVDNSAGVDCSDHEVNIKILLNAVPSNAKLDLDERNKMLVQMTDDVAALVLRDNYLQSQAISMLQARANTDVLEHAHTIRSLELSGQLDRALEFLPDAEQIAERRRAGQGLTRPELGILLAYAKMALYSHLIDSDVPEDPYLGHELERYFPALIVKRCGKFLRQHRLRREIIATATTNSMVNRMGATFARRAQEDTGAAAATVVRAYAIAREAFAMRDTWGSIEALDTRIDAQMQYEMMFETTRLLRFCSYQLIRNHSGRLDIEEQVVRLRAGLKQLDAALPEVLSGADLDAFQARSARYHAARVPEALCKRIASLPVLRAGIDLIELAEHSKLTMEAVAGVYFAIGTALSLDWLREQIESLAVEGHWQAVARSTLRDNLYTLQRALCLQALKPKAANPPRRSDAKQAVQVQAWLEQNRTTVEHLQQVLSEMRALPQMDFATLSVALQAVRRVGA